MFELEAFLTKEQMRYKKNSSACKAINQIMMELRQQKNLADILEDEEDPIKSGLPKQLRHILDLMTFSNRRVIEDTFVIMGSPGETSYFREISRRLFDNQSKEEMEAAFNDVNEKIGAEVLQAETTFLKQNFDKLQTATARYLTACQFHGCKDAASEQRKKVMEDVKEKLEEPISDGESDLIFYRNRIKNALTFLATRQDGETHMDRIKQDRSPFAKAFLASVAAISSVLMIGIIPTLGAMIYSKKNYGTIKFWQASKGQLMDKSIKNTEQELGLNLGQKI